MHTNNTFSLQRQQQVMFRQFSLQKSRILLYVAGIFGIYLLINLAFAFTQPASIGGAIDGFKPILWIGGFVFTSQIFNELNSRQQSYALLTLPASPLEKLLAAWFISGPVLALLVSLGCYLITLLGFLVAGVPLTEVDFFNEAFKDKIVAYLIMQTVFLWGSAYFKNHNFGKTILSLVVLGVAVGIYIFFLMRTSMLWSDIEHTTITSSGRPEWLRQMGGFFLMLLGPYMLLTTYFTIKERQV